MTSQQRRCTAFEGSHRLASGVVSDVLPVARSALERGEAPVLIFDDETAELIEIDFRKERSKVPASPPAEAVAENGRATASSEKETTRGPGRPKLGVVGREVTLLPRHWDWLGRQPGGASVALRKLVDEARRAHESRDRKRGAQAAAYRFMHAMAGDLPGFEEASRALFARDADRFAAMTGGWPRDLRDYAQRLAAAAF